MNTKKDYKVIEGEGSLTINHPEAFNQGVIFSSTGDHDNAYLDLNELREYLILPWHRRLFKQSPIKCFAEAYKRTGHFVIKHTPEQ